VDVINENAQFAGYAQQGYARVARGEVGSFPPIALGLTRVADHHGSHRYGCPNDGRSSRNDCYVDRCIGHT
jgi:hypothetical protein